MTYFILTLIANLIIYFSGYFVGRNAARREFVTIISENPEKIIKLIDNLKTAKELWDEDEVGTEIYLERRADNCYLYFKKNDVFLAQGPTLETALKAAHERFPGQVFFGELDSDHT